KKGQATCHVQRGREKRTSEVSKPTDADVPPAGAGLGVHPAPHLRPAAFLPARGLAALSPRCKPRFRAGFRKNQDPLSATSDRKARLVAIRVVLLSPLLCRYPFSSSRHRQGCRPENGTSDERARARREPCFHCIF